MKKNYIGVIKFKSNKSYEEFKGFKYNTGTEDIGKAKEILNRLCSNLSENNGVQVRWNFEGCSQGHYCDDWYWVEKGEL